MKTVTVELKHESALKLLKDLELAEIIRLITPQKSKLNSSLSSQLKGSISKSRASELTNQIEKLREEWKTRNT